MILIKCPNCGPRDETEYHYGGEAHVPYPEDPHALSDAEWGRYLFYRQNPKGLFAERWGNDDTPPFGPLREFSQPRRRAVR